jgi:CheY-like chemotaxis protein
MAEPVDVLADFVAGLAQLHWRAGSPSLSALGRLTGQAGYRLPRSTIHQKLRGDSPSDWRFTAAFVGACLVHGRRHARQLTEADGDLEAWRAVAGRRLRVVLDNAADYEHVRLLLPGRGRTRMRLRSSGARSPPATVAATGPEALKLAENSGEDIHLLLTDVVMPQMLGKELAGTMRQLRPNVAVLYMSGYAQPVLAGQGTLDPGVMFLEKPFSERALLEKGRQALDPA